MCTFKILRSILLLPIPINIRYCTVLATYYPRFPAITPAFALRAGPPSKMFNWKPECEIQLREWHTFDLLSSAEDGGGGHAGERSSAGGSWVTSTPTWSSPWTTSRWRSGLRGGWWRRPSCTRRATEAQILLITYSMCTLWVTILNRQHFTLHWSNTGVLIYFYFTLIPLSLTYKILFLLLHLLQNSKCITDYATKVKIDVLMFSPSV